MSKSTDTTTNPRCGDCVNMRKEDGYCGRLGRYVNYFRVACKDFADRIEAAEKESLASMPEPEEPEVRVKADAKIRRKGILHPDPKPTTKICKDCGRELPLDQFPRHPKSRDGHTSVCAECYSKKMKAVHAKADAAQPKESLPEGQRRCSKCGRVLPVSEFARRSKSKDGLQYECRDCKKAAKVTSDKNVPLTLSEEPEPKYKPITVRDLSDEDLVAELRYRGWKVACTKEL